MMMHKNKITINFEKWIFWAVIGGVSDEGSFISRELGMHINGGRTRVALEHAGALKKLDGGLALGE
jgi:hypothetical protein